MAASAFPGGIARREVAPRRSSAVQSTAARGGSNVCSSLDGQERRGRLTATGKQLALSLKAERMGEDPKALPPLRALGNPQNPPTGERINTDHSRPCEGEWL